MGWGDKIRNAADKIGAKGRHSAGNTTGNHGLKAEGKGTHARAEFKDIGDKVKGAFKKRH